MDDDQDIDLVTGEVGLHATPMIAKDIVVIGAAHRPGGVPRGKTNVKGYVRGFDVRTGKRLWIFHTIPGLGEFGNDTWEKDSWKYTGNAGVWGQMGIDEDLEMVYLPVELPTGDYYGGNRPGAGLFGETLVALDLRTGQRKWHFQFIHHGIWDFDMANPPILGDITVNGRTIKAIAQPTKQSFLYVFDRTNGQPVWPIVERPVPKGDVPGEWYSPTQPFVTKPPAYDRQGTSIDDLIDFTPELRAQAVEFVKKYKLGPLFTPPVMSKVEGPIGMLMLPSAGGGSNWAGGSFDPETHRLYIYSQTTPTSLGLVPAPPNNDFGLVSGNAATAAARAGGAGRGGAGAAAGRGAPAGGRAGAPEPAVVPSPATVASAAAAEGGGGGGLTIQGLPLIKPPYGRITAFDMDKGDILWQVAHGETPDNIRNHPALERAEHPADRSSRHHRHARHQDAGHRRRTAVHDDAAGTRGDAARLRQGDREGSGRRLHAGAAKRIADDLHAERQAVHRARHRRRHVPRGVHRLQGGRVSGLNVAGCWLSSNLPRGSSRVTSPS